MRTIAVIVFASALLISTARAQPDVTAGQRHYELCAGCHGFTGEGNQLVAAPRLAGIEAWYVERQIQNFADGSRGHVAGDDNGQRMALMARAVDTDRKLEDLVAYIASLPVIERPQATVDGDPGRGQSAYSLCAACHGVDASGNAAVESPGLAMLDDWYVVEQLRQYAEGIRGVSDSDPYGQQMRAISSSFANDALRRDIAAYIQSLGR